GCSGAGASKWALPQPPFASHGFAPHGTATASIAFSIPSTTKTTNGFVPRSTTGFVVTVHGVTAYQGSAGQGHVSATFSVPSGKDAFEVSLVNGFSTLSRARFVQNMASGKTTALHPVFHGVVARAEAVVKTNPPVGTPSRFPLSAKAWDEAGDLISQGLYDQPISLKVAGRDPHMHVSGRQLQGTSSAVTVSYDGHLMLKPIVVTFVNVQNYDYSGDVSVSLLAQAYTTFPFSGTVNDIAVAPNHVLWFAQCTPGKACDIGSIDTAGRVKTIAKTAWVQNLTVGADGNVWFTVGENRKGQKGATIGKLTPAGKLTLNVFHTYGPHTGFGTFSIAAGADKNLWFTDLYGFDRMTPDGEITQFPLASGWFRPSYLAVGTDGKVYADDGVWSIVSCDRNGTIASVGSFDNQLHAPLVWYDHRLIVFDKGKGPAAVSESGAIRVLKPEFTLPAADGPKGTLIGFGRGSNPSSALYGIEIFQLKGSTLVGPTYPEVDVSGAAPYITKVVADNNGYFWATGGSSVMRFRYDP
ncbi:MAG TPA: hypothetical protein VKB39_01385, partial [Candidatus Baltobacteraceae bacterium]|nr:hypothetical protein [Candidatus Baltobacteraceae bacterium]